MPLYKNTKRLSPTLLLFFVANIAFSDTVLAQPPCLPAPPVSIKKLPLSVRNNPQALAAIKRANELPWYKKTIITDFSSPNIDHFSSPGFDHWINTYISICPGEHLKIRARGELKFPGDKNNPNAYVCTPDGALGSDIGGCLNTFGIRCNSLIARIDRNIGDFGEAFQIGSKYHVIVKEAGVLKLSINSSEVGFLIGKWVIDIQISADDECDFPEGSTAADIGDVVIYWAENTITHSGYVTVVNDCKVYGINCYLQKTLIDNYLKVPYNEVVQNVNPDTSVLRTLFGNWTVYHTNRTKQRLISKTIGQVYDISNKEHYPVVVGITDLGTIITFRHILSDKGKRDDGEKIFNCHGFTFIEVNMIENNSWAIDGYILNKVQHSNTDESSIDQSNAVKLILFENGYKQVHAFGTDGKDHFNPAYEVTKSSLPK